MPRRRSLTCRPLLIATTATLSVGCKDKPVEPAPEAASTARLCVQTTPPDATVTFNGTPDEDKCISPDSDTTAITIEVSAMGYDLHREEVPVPSEMQTIFITLEPPPPPPVGNLMPPPQPPPQPPPPPPDPAGDEGNTP